MSVKRFAFTLMGLALTFSVPGWATSNRVAVGGMPTPLMAIGSLVGGGGVPFTSTMFDDQAISEADGYFLRSEPGLTIKGGATLPELRAAYTRQIAPALAERGLVLLTPGENLAARKMQGHDLSPLMPVPEGALVFTTRDNAALKSLVNKLTWIGRRQTGRISGSVTRLYVTIFPEDLNFSGDSASFQPKVGVFGTWASVVGMQASGPNMDMSTYNADDLVAELMFAMGGPAKAKALTELERINGELVATSKRLGDDWAKLSAEKHYEGKLPAKWVVNQGLDGSLRPVLDSLFKNIQQNLVDGDDPSNVITALERMKASIAKVVSGMSAVKKDGRWPEGFDPDAAWDGSRLLISHEVEMVKLLEDAKTVVGNI